MYTREKKHYPVYLGPMRQILPQICLFAPLIFVCCSPGELTNELAGYAATTTPCPSIESRPSSSIADQAAAAGITDSTKTYAYVLEEGEEAIFTRAWLSQNSQKTIDIQYFIFSLDNVGIIALDYLLRAADRGVKIRMLVDDIMLDVAESDVLALNAHPNLEIHIYNANPGKNGFQQALHAATDFKGFNQRMHNKTFIADGSVAITGGRNIADEYFDYDQEYNFRDRDVMLIGVGADSIQQSFDSFWEHPLAMTITGHDESDSQGNDELYRRIHAYACDTENFWPEIRALINGIPEAIPRLQAAGKLHAVEEFSFVSDVPGKNESPGFTGGGKSTDALLQLVQQAKESVMIQSPYLVLTEMGLDLFQAAVERGVDVTILTNSLSSTDNLEAFNGYQRIRSELLAAGVHVYEYRPDAAIRKRLITAEKQKELDYMPTFGLHAKSMVVDHRTTVIGTFNLDPRSANLNTECIAIMTSAAMALQVEALMVEELSPANAWQTTARFNPDSEATAWKRLKTWTRGMVPASIL